MFPSHGTTMQVGPTILPYLASVEKFIWGKVQILLVLVAFNQGHIMGHSGWSNICPPCSELSKCPNVQMSTACVCRPDLMKHASLTLAVVLCPVPGDSYTNSKTKFTHISANTQISVQTHKWKDKHRNTISLRSYVLLAPAGRRSSKGELLRHCSNITLQSAL